MPIVLRAEGGADPPLSFPLSRLLVMLSPTSFGATCLRNFRSVGNDAHMMIRFASTRLQNANRISYSFQGQTSR